VIRQELQHFPPHTFLRSHPSEKEKKDEGDDRSVQTSGHRLHHIPIFPYFETPVWAVKNSANMTALGYLVGPTIGSLLYSATHPSLARGSPSPLEVMDKAFYDHIKANRASPAFQSVNNPAPDFYGEKVCPCRHQYHLHSESAWTPRGRVTTFWHRKKLTIRSSRYQHIGGG
jgi:hypothetical protein